MNKLIITLCFLVLCLTGCHYEYENFNGYDITYVANGKQYLTHVNCEHYEWPTTEIKVETKFIDDKYINHYKLVFNGPYGHVYEIYTSYTPITLISVKESYE